MDLIITLDNITESVVVVPSGTRRLMLSNLSNSIIYYAFVSGDADSTSGEILREFQEKDLGDILMTGVTVYATSNIKGCRMGFTFSK